MALRIVFMGTPDFSVPVLQALLQSSHHVVSVFTQPARPSGRRGLQKVASPVQICAQAAGIAVHTPVSLRRDDVLACLKSYQADVIVVVAYGLLLPSSVLNLPTYGCYNAHASLLPRWRGAAPIQRAIMAGDCETGVTIMKMEEGLDTGPMALVERQNIFPEMTAGQLHDQLSMQSAHLMVKAMDALEAGILSLQPQPEKGVTYANKIDKQETRLNWQDDLMFLQRKIHGLSPFPGAWCEMEIDEIMTRVKILQACICEEKEATPLSIHSYKDGRFLCFTRVQKAGGRVMSAKEFLHGHSNFKIV